MANDYPKHIQTPNGEWIVPDKDTEDGLMSGEYEPPPPPRSAQAATPVAPPWRREKTS